MVRIIPYNFRMSLISPLFKGFCRESSLILALGPPGPEARGTPLYFVHCTWWTADLGLFLSHGTGAVPHVGAHLHLAEGTLAGCG